MECVHNLDTFRYGRLDNAVCRWLIWWVLVWLWLVNIILCDRTNSNRQRNPLDLDNGILLCLHVLRPAVGTQYDPLSRMHRRRKWNHNDYIRSAGNHRPHLVGMIFLPHMPQWHTQILSLSLANDGKISGVNRINFAWIRIAQNQRKWFPVETHNHLPFRLICTEIQTQTDSKHADAHSFYTRIFFRHRKLC